jgi:hypothetical protein
MPPLDGVFCSTRCPDRTGFAAMGSSLFEAAAKALEWVEAARRMFGAARRDDQVLVIGVGMAPDRWYRVRIGRIRRWIRENGRTDCEG